MSIAQSILMKKPGDVIRASDWNGLLQAVGGAPSKGPSRFKQFSARQFLAAIADPPDGESPFSDERYWVLEIHAANANVEGTYRDKLTLAEMDGTSSLVRHVPATHLAELESQTHTLTDGQLVFVHELRDAVGVVHYVFRTGGVGDGVFLGFVTSIVPFKVRKAKAAPTAGGVIARWNFDPAAVAQDAEPSHGYREGDYSTLWLVPAGEPTIEDWPCLCVMQNGVLVAIPMLVHPTDPEPADPPECEECPPCP